MNLTALLIASLVVLPAASVSAWAWLAMAQAENDLRLFTSVHHLHLDT